MIIWGSRGMQTRGESGEFNCPDCRSRQGYQRHKVERFFTLYFIPLIPLGTVHESIKCQGCNRHYVTDILNYDPSREQAAANQQIGEWYGRILCHFPAMTGRRDADFVHQVQLAYAELGVGSMTEAEVETGLGRNNNIGPATVSLSRCLNDRGREIVVRNALALATTGAALDDAKRAGITELAGKLEMSQTHLAGVFASAPQQPALTAH